jgi:hypothetical protein
MLRVGRERESARARKAKAKAGAGPARRRLSGRGLLMQALDLLAPMRSQPGEAKGRRKEGGGGGYDRIEAWSSSGLASCLSKDGMAGATWTSERGCG